MFLTRCNFFSCLLQQPQLICLLIVRRLCLRTLKDSIKSSRKAKEIFTVFKRCCIFAREICQFVAKIRFVHWISDLFSYLTFSSKVQAWVLLQLLSIIQCLNLHCHSKEKFGKMVISILAEFMFRYFAIQRVLLKTRQCLIPTLHAYITLLCSRMIDGTWSNEFVEHGTLRKKLAKEMTRRMCFHEKCL